MTPFSPIQELKIGHVVEVSGTTAKVELSGEVAELSRTHAGRVYDIGQIGSVVKIHFGRRLIFGFVTMLRMRSEELAESGLPIPPDADQRVMEIELFAEGIWSSAGKTLSFHRGVSTYPLPRQSVFILTREETALLYQAAEQKIEEGKPNPLVSFARYVGADGALCRANIDRMFSTHCAILGSTGSGKSGAVAALLHGVLDHQASPNSTFNPRIVVIDPHGEYSHAFGASATAFRAYGPPIAEDAGHPIKLPYWLMSGDEFRHLLIGKTEFEATSQNNIVYKALTHARLVAAGLALPTFTGYGEAVPDDGLPLDASRPAVGVTHEQLAQFDRDKPRPFALREFANHIEFAQGARATAANLTQKVPDGDFAKSGFKSILDKLTVLRRDARIEFLMAELNPEGPTLSTIISQFVGDTDTVATSLRIIDISGLPNEVAGPLTAMLCRLLFLYKLHQSVEERRSDPLLLVCEEAHRYVPDRGEAEYAIAQSAVRRIAREGRKYGLALMLVSQRPSDIESTVIAQCGTWLVLRLTNSADQQHVGRFLPDGLSGMVRALSSLGQQEALFVGEGASLPARVKIFDLPPNRRPQSASVSFAEGWTATRLSAEALTPIVARMTA